MCPSGSGILQVPAGTTQSRIPCEVRNTPNVGERWKRSESGVALCQQAIGTVRASDLGEGSGRVVIEVVVGHTDLRRKSGKSKDGEKSDSGGKLHCADKWFED